MKFNMIKHDVTISGLVDPFLTVYQSKDYYIKHTNVEFDRDRFIIKEPKIIAAWRGNVLEYDCKSIEDAKRICRGHLDNVGKEILDDDGRRILDVRLSTLRTECRRIEAMIQVGVFGNWTKDELENKLDNARLDLEEAKAILKVQLEHDDEV